MTEFETNYLAHHGVKGFDNVIYTKSLDEAGDFLEHYQIKGAKHGVRRFQNYDGTLTPAGRERYGIGPPREKKTDDGPVKKAANAVKKKVQDAKEKRATKKQAQMSEYLRDHPKKLIKFKRSISKEEADKIISNIEFDRRLQDIRDSEIERGRARFKNKVAHVAQIKKLMNEGTAIYNSTANIATALSQAGVIDASMLGGFVDANGNVITIPTK